ncbi:hypothetical protein EES38_01335 [Vibrio viridaestus]|uniref:Uncharacterized protein n=2 Tax=Vibrio viridaestus TaxID=2487322 RepID=A0A3N9TMD7_9VIBR|nr:hypothetical protein EES38_01335 [Vibrio viridaestus]
MTVPILLALFSLSGQGAVLDTPNYIVDIELHCAEGNVSCDNVTYKGVSKRSSNQIILKGHTLHRSCSDGKTPCQFVGYEFVNGKVQYRVFETGLLQVKNNHGVTLIEEQGQWNYDSTSGKE